MGAFCLTSVYREVRFLPPSDETCPMRPSLLVCKLSVASAIAVLAPVEPAQADSQCGTAAYYDQGAITANGEAFDPGALTAAHPWLPLNSWVTVVDQDTGISTEVRINDRGPWDGRILDMTPAVINIIDPNQTSDLREVCIYW
jgi:rare lipoprotein A